MVEKNLNIKLGDILGGGGDDDDCDDSLQEVDMREAPGARSAAGVSRSMSPVKRAKRCASEKENVDELNFYR